MLDRIRRGLFPIPTLPITALLLASVGLAAAVAAEPLRSRPASPGHDDVRHALPHWPLHPVDAERALARAELHVTRDRSAGRGVTGARRLSIELPGLGERFDVKWKPAPRLLDILNNSPRRELAAYQVQRLFLDPADYVVPTSVLRCLDGEAWGDIRPVVAQTIRGTRCELGVLSIWLEDLGLPDPLLDPDRFERDQRYAEAIADFNLALYLMKHQDGRKGNFLVARNEARPHFFSVDNGVAWSGLLYNWFVPNWKRIRVPALRRASVERLRRLERDDLAFLGVVAELEWRPREGLVDVEPGPNLDPVQGVRVEGRTIQIGLDQNEIESLAGRIERLIEEVDRGGIPVF